MNPAARSSRGTPVTAASRLREALALLAGFTSCSIPGNRADRQAGASDSSVSHVAKGPSDRFCPDNRQLLQGGCAALLLELRVTTSALLPDIAPSFLHSSVDKDR